MDYLLFYIIMDFEDPVVFPIPSVCFPFGWTSSLLPVPLRKIIILPVRSPEAYLPQGEETLKIIPFEAGNSPGQMAFESNPNSTSTSRSVSCKTLGRKLLFNHSEFVTLMVSSLYSLGYRRAASSLELESGIPLDSPELASLLFHVLSGRWNDCIFTIDSIENVKATIRSDAAFLVWREHFLELLGSGDGLSLAIDVLRKRISPLELDRRRIHGLARALVSLEGVVTVENVVRRRIGLLLDLVEVLPPWVRVPRGRMEYLVETAVRKQVESCVYHNLPEEVSLYEDHDCSKEHIPCKCSQILFNHRNEVWFVQFSNNGEYLASSSSDCTAIIWKLL